MGNVLVSNSNGQPEWKPILSINGENSVGSFQFGDMKISSSKKPNKIRRFIMDKFFTIKWIDNEPPPMTEEETINEKRGMILDDILKKNWFERIWKKKY
jgi:hypothetical protein